MRKTIHTALLLASATAGAQTFPASGWVSLKQGGVDIVDPRQDIALGQPERDIIGDASNPAAYVYSDGTYAYFRLRVDGDAETGGVFMGFGWACQLSTDGDPTGYELMILLNGKDPQAVEVWREDPPKTNDPGEVADTFVTQYEGTRFDELTQAIPAGSAIGGAGDHFVDWAIPIADLPGVALTSSIQLVCGTNSNGNPVLTTGGSADVMNEAPARMTWSTIASDPITFGCGTFGCTGNLSCAPNGQCVECETSADCPAAEPICVDGMCEVCDADSECVSRDPETPACLEAPGPGSCVECEDNTDCASPTPICNLTTHVCEPECTTSAECADPGEPICSNGSCVPCTLDAQCDNRDPANPACNAGGECVPCTATNEELCTDGGLVCDDPNQVCVECNVDAQCGPTEPICNENHVCVPECETSAQCTEDPGRPICHTGACVPCSLDMECEDKNADTPACVMESGDSHFGHCVECSATADGICTSAQPPQVCDVPVHVCAGCVEDSDCQGAGDPPNTPECSDAQQCVACSSDDVCGARDPEEPACQPDGTTHAGACGECSETNDDRCTGAKPVCDTDEGVCVACLVNSDCTTAEAPFCDIATHTCVAGCDDDGDCPEPRPVCNVEGPLDGLCTECSVEKTQRCQGTDEPICNPADGTCVECLVTPDCPTGVCLANQCVECVTNADCPTAEPFCNTGSHTCQEDCPSDAACPGQTPVCNFTGPLTGQCSECAPRDSHLCTNDEPVCDPTSGTCVECTTSAQCPGGTCVDHICVVVPPPGPDAGVPLPPDAAVATPDAAEPPPTPDAAVVVVDAPPAPAPDAAVATPDAAVAMPDAAAPAVDARLADARTPDARTPDGRIEDPITPAGGLVAGGGCDCRAAGGSSSGSAAWSLLVVGLFVIVRRRRGAGR